MTEPVESLCRCGKVRYHTRADARLDARRFRQRVGRLNAYLCPTSGMFWHLGHLSKASRNGYAKERH